MGKAQKSAGDLTPGESRFVLEYLVDRNGTQAAIRAGYAIKAAHVTASKLMKRVRVRQAIERVAGKIEAKLEISIERTLQEIARVAFFDIRKVFNHDGSLTKIAELDGDTAAALASIEAVDDVLGNVKVGEIRKIKTHLKGPFLDILMKHFGGYRVGNTQKAGAIAELLAEIGARNLGLGVVP